jgi:hypothetical protein
MINKEWCCKTCGDFESAIGVCKRCGEKATRVFRTPPGISPKNMSRRIDKLVESEFSRRKISNYTNRGGTQKVEFANSYASASGQPPITGGWGKQSLTQFNAQYGTNFQLPIQTPPEIDPGAPPQPPRIAQPWAKQVPTETTAQ